MYPGQVFFGCYMFERENVTGSFWRKIWQVTGFVYAILQHHAINRVHLLHTPPI